MLCFDGWTALKAMQRFHRVSASGQASDVIIGIIRAT